MRNALIIGVWLLAAVLLFLVLMYSDQYTESECIKSGGSYVMGTWTKECKHK